jgi:hypothetical protein
MATHESTLTFLLRADGSQAKSEIMSLRSVVNKEARSIGEGFSSQIPVIGRFSNLMSPTALGIAAVGVATVGTVAGLVALARDATEAGSRFNDLSLKTGLSVETLSGLDLQLKQSGTSLETLATGFFNLQKQQAAARDGSDQAAGALKRVGVDAKATTEDALRQFVKGLSEIKDAGARNAAGAAVMGKAYKDLSVFIEDTGGDLDAVVEAARRAGRQMSTETAAAADVLGDKLDEVSYSLAAMGRGMISPALPAFVGALNDVTNASGDTAGGLYAIGMAIASIIDGGRIAAGVLKAIADNDIRRIPDVYNAIKTEQAGRPAAAAAALDAARKRQRGGDSGGESGGGKRGGGAATDDRGALLQQETRGIEREYRAQTQIIKREQDLQLTSLRDATTRIIQAENDRYSALMDALDKRLALAKKESEREGIRGEQREAEIERDKNIQDARDAQYVQERAAAEAHTQTMLKRGEQYDADRIASIKAQADLRAITHERAEEKIEAIESASFKRSLAFNQVKIKALQTLAGFEFDAMGNIIESEKAQSRLDVEELQKLQDAASQIIAEWDGAILDSERKRDAARKRDLANAREWAREMRELELSVLRAALDVGQLDINRMRRRNQDKRDVAKAQADLDREDERLAHEGEMQKIEDRQRDFNEEVHTFEERIAALIAFNQARELEKERHKRRLKEIKDGEKQESGEGGDLLDPLRAVLNERVSLHNFAANAIAGTFRTITDAVGETVKSYILYGELTGKLIRKAVAEQIASLASLAVKQGLYWTAQGIADLFWNPPRAAADFAAAAGFFAVGGGLAFVGRKVAGNAFQDQASGGAIGAGANGGGDDQGVRYREFNYGGNNGFSSSQVAGDGSRNTGGIGGMIREALTAIEQRGAERDRTLYATVDRLAGVLNKYEMASPGDVVQRGADTLGGESAIAKATLRHSNSSHAFNQDLLNNLGFSR